MPKTNFVTNTPITAAFLNAVNNPSYTANPANDGELPLIRDIDLDQSAGALLSRSNEYLNAFNTTTASGLIVTVSAGTVVLGDGTPVAKPATQISLPASATRFIWVDPFGVFQQGLINPNDGSVMLARVTTDATKVTAISDLRPRFQIGTVNYNAPAVVGQSVYFEFPVIGFEYTDEMGWKWLNPQGGVKISKSGAGGQVASDGYERLFKRLWSAPGYLVYNNSATPLAKGATAGIDWQAGRQLGIPDPALRAIVAAGSFSNTTYGVGEAGGAREVALSNAQIPIHDHPGSSAAHSHTYQKLVETGGVGNTYYPPGNGEGQLTTENTSSATISVNVGQAGGNEAHPNMPPYSVATKMIFTGIKA